jgi:hypothetical protein
VDIDQSNGIRYIKINKSIVPRRRRSKAKEEEDHSGS